MISLKKHIDDWNGQSADPSLGFYRSLLSAVGKYSYRAVPGLGRDLEQKLLDLDAGLQKDISNPVFPDVLAQTNQKAEAEFAQGAARPFPRHKANEQELREIIHA